MLPAYVAKEISENFPNRKYQSELLSVEDAIRQAAENGSKKIEFPLDELENKDTIIQELQKLQYKVNKTDYKLLSKSVHLISW